MKYNLSNDETGDNDVYWREAHDFCIDIGYDGLISFK